MGKAPFDTATEYGRLAGGGGKPSCASLCNRRCMSAALRPAGPAILRACMSSSHRACISVGSSVGPAILHAWSGGASQGSPRRQLLLGLRAQARRGLEVRAAAASGGSAQVGGAVPVRVGRGEQVTEQGDGDRRELVPHVPSGVRAVRRKRSVLLEGAHDALGVGAQGAQVAQVELQQDGERRDVARDGRTVGAPRAQRARRWVMRRGGARGGERAGRALRARRA